MSAPVVETTHATLLPGEPDTFPWGVSGAGSIPVRVSMRWSPVDPLAVRLSFDTGTNGPVTWFLARDLLATGLLMPAGDGDVHLRPYDLHLPDDAVLAVRLRNHKQEQAWFLFAAGRVGAFLEATYQQCPRGSEQVDVDRALALCRDLGGGLR